jgi:hypothetical protein
MLLIEAGLVILALLLAFVVPSVGSSLFVHIERQLAHLAKRRILSVVLVGAFALAMRAAVLPILPVPYPALQDEFSYQLMADTFAHGRLTNPTHPMWVHFESIAVIHQPTYCSMFYPGQGLLMALGELIGRHTFWGVWLSIGIMCAAICWMLQAWVSPFWALIVGLLAAIRIGAFSYWANSYWGGAVAAIGGALVLGALPRIKRHCKIRDALLMGLGFAILANTRPFEGLFFSIPVIGILIIWILHQRKDQLRQTFSRVVLPLALVLVGSGSLMMLYFWRTTGSPLLPPYIVSLRTYFVDPSFSWLPLRPIPHYQHDILRRHQLGFNVGQYYFARLHPIFAVVVKILMLWFFFLGPLLSLPLLSLAFVLPRDTSLKDIGRKGGVLIAVCIATILGIALPVYTNPHYAAPFTAAVYGVIALSMHRVRHWSNRGKRNGIALVRAIPALAVVLLGLRIAIPVFHLPIPNPAIPQTWASPWFQLLPRAKVEALVESNPGNHLVIVHYSSAHDPREGWVSNAADIDNSKIVWAHDMGPEKNGKLMRYFSGRHVWDVYPDTNPIQLTPHQGSTTLKQ